ncbi:MAG: orotidine-5'-phosphate decarboxylase [Fidelibacterota bacterium]
MVPFNTHLSRLIRSRHSALCVGLDLAPETLPGSPGSLKALQHLTATIIDATRDVVVAYKPNLAFFERWGSRGYQWLEETMGLLGDEVVVIGDAKRGDIGTSAQQYARALFDHFGFDAVTVNPYMGREAMEPFITDPQRGAFVLCRTSNPSASDLQDLVVEEGTLYEQTARLAVKLNVHNNIGLVVGATAPREVQRIRNLAPDVPFLLPGVGAQGGELETCLRRANHNGLALITVSRGITHVGDGSYQAIREAARTYARRIRAILND